MKKFSNRSLFPFLMGTLALMCFLAVALVLSFSVVPPWGRMLPLILPAVSLFVIAFMSQKEKLSGRMTVVLTLIASVVLLTASFFYTVLLCVWTATADVENVKYYPKAYSQIKDGEAVEGIFPEAVPEGAEEVYFHYNAPFLQGGEMFELSYTASAGELSQWEDFLESKSEWVGSNEDWHRMNNWGFIGEDSTRYQLYWDGGYNHGEWSYVLINPSSSRITFRYEDW